MFIYCVLSTICGQSAARFFPVNHLAHSDGGSVHTVPYLMLLCRILRRQDRPTAHPRHREYASPLAANRRRNTDRWRRQLTKLPRPFPQYPPLTLRYGMMRLLHCASGAACAGQWPWVPARTFDVIVLTEQRCDLPTSLSRRQSKRPTPCRSKVSLAY